MKKEEYSTKLSIQLGKTKKDINLIIDAFLEELIQKIEIEGKASITNFGTFTKIKTKPFEYFSPVDGKHSIKTDGITKVSFSSSKGLLKRLSK